MRLRKVGDYLISPARGKPKPPEGYEFVRGEKFVFQLCIDPCDKREYRKHTKGCCASARFPFCLVLGMKMTRQQCKDCNKQWLTDYQKKYGLSAKGQV